MISFLLLEGCALENTRPTLTMAPQPAWLTKFLENPTCQHPCWENITPNETSIDEARAILTMNPEIRITEIYPDYIEWDFYPNTASGFVECGYKENIVEIIRFSFPGVQLLTLGELLNHYPVPTHIDFDWDSHNRKRCYLRIFFESQGLEVRTETTLSCKWSKRDEKDTLTVDVTPELSINHMSIFSTSDSQAPFDKWLKWNGFGEYSKEFER